MVKSVIVDFEKTSCESKPKVKSKRQIFLVTHLLELPSKTQSIKPCDSEPLKSIRKDYS